MLDKAYIFEANYIILVKQGGKKSSLDWSRPWNLWSQSTALILCRGLVFLCILCKILFFIPELLAMLFTLKQEHWQHKVQNMRGHSFNSYNSFRSFWWGILILDNAYIFSIDSIMCWIQLLEKMVGGQIKSI